MNLIRTIQRTEQKSWINTLFTPGPHSGKVYPLSPRQLPFPCRLRQNVTGGTVYLLYQRRIIAYGTIDQVVYRPSVMPVGSQLQPVKPGDTVIVRGVFAHMPAALQQVEARGFMGPRYTAQDLHTLGPKALRRELQTGNSAHNWDREPDDLIRSFPRDFVCL
jgi:hypothetical protein